MRENNQSRGETYTYTYDECGNITLKSTYNYSTGSLSTMKSHAQYGYSDGAWGDILTSYGEEAFFSDAYGNILGFGEYEFLWQAGKLAGAESSDQTISYTYNDEGLRIGKTVNGVQHRYVMIGTQLISEIIGAEIVTYFYDASGRPIGMRYMNTDDSFALEHYFYFELNIFGDIVAVYDEEYNKILSYSYDAWGNFTTTVHTTDTEKAYKAQCNSLTYRGYYYDEETNLYYLQTRYYSPELCRFIQPDNIEYLDPSSINGLNLYCYCMNNPIMYVDPTGHFAISTFLIGLAVSSLVTWGLSEIFGAQIVGGASSMVNGYGAITTGLGLLSFGPVGWVAGGLSIIAGAGAMIIGANEIVDGITGTNYIQECTGWSDDLYNGLYIGSNIVSSVGTIAGNIYMKYNPPYPGRNPNKIPDGFNDRVNPKANYYNPKTDQSLRPDLNHAEPYGPHWDWKDSNGQWWRLYRFWRKIK